MATERLCLNCRTWHNVKLHACPDCGRERYGPNSHLVTSSLNSHLYKQAESAEREKKFMKARRRGYDIPPTKRQQKLARQIVSDM